MGSRHRGFLLTAAFFSALILLVGGSSGALALKRMESEHEKYFVESGEEVEVKITLVNVDDDREIRILDLFTTDFIVNGGKSYSNPPPDRWVVELKKVVVNGEDLGRVTTFTIPESSKVEIYITVKYLGEKGGETLSFTVVAVTEGMGEFNTDVMVESGEEKLSYIYVTMGVSLLGLVAAALIFRSIISIEVESEKVNEIASAIKEGAMAFLKGEYKVIVVYAIVVAAILTALGFLSDFFSRVSGAVFLFGAFLSALAGNIGMRTATSSSSRTVWTVKDDMREGLKIAFSSGAVMGLSVVSLGLMGLAIVYSVLRSPDVLFSFGFGASSIALFARVGGGIYTKSADVGADLVGKVEKGIPEDDPRNPAVIADNVGDNVGDVAGMGADLFESYVDSIIASIAIGIMGVVIAGSDPSFGGKLGLAATLPMLLATLGIMSSLVGIFLVGKGSGEDPHAELNRGMFGASVIFAIAAFIIIYKLMGAAYIGLYWGVLAGLLSGIVIGLTTEYYTSDKYRPTRKLAESSKTGAATNIIEGLALGMLSPAIPVITVSVTILIAYHFAGLYGIALAAVGMLSTLGVTLATDSYGPVADNAAGLAEMAGLGKRTRERAEALDAVGNTTAAIGKGFAIGSAALTALALFTTYTAAAHLSIASFSLSRPDVIVGLFIGGLLPFLFSSMTMQAVGKTAMAMVEEVRRQFKTIRGLMSGKAKPDYARCVEISTHAALKEMIVPSLTAILSPVVVGFLLGPEALGGLLAGAIVSGFVLAIMMANSGGAWDNAKKYIEKGNFGGKGSSPHKAAVVGDTVGDPFKDTSGPSLNILIKLMSIVALVFAPFF